jgi:hypothetical protein
MATSLAAKPDSKRARPRRWRSVLAALISLALVLSFFHSIDGDDGIVTVAAAQTSCDASGKAPVDSPAAPHGDHCLAHVTTVAPQDSAVAIEYVTRLYRLAAMPLPEAADLASPFKPPRA